MVLGSSGFNSGASCFFFNIIAKKVLSPRPREGTVCSRPYRSERTGSLSNSEVNRRRARSVLGWGTAWEAIRVLLAFHLCPPLFLQEVRNIRALPNASGHTATNTPDLFRTPKLTVAGPCQYWGGGPPGKPFGCC